jgi:hypothetical protein
MPEDNKRPASQSSWAVGGHGGTGSPSAWGGSGATSYSSTFVVDPWAITGGHWDGSHSWIRFANGQTVRKDMFDAILRHGRPVSTPYD